ncbi:hypothetical protein [Henriciella sp.]|uniref:hypothetical protein n=1 Tax=Henriciella sp. TaxID=1968823 RepID=UPI002639D178|nr:hypothetical protein [Henriciella sp.]
MFPHRLSHAALAIVLCVSGAGCATQPDPCTPEWIEWKTDRVLTRFAGENRDTVRALRNMPGNIENPDAIMALRIAALMVDFEDLARDFDRIVMPEINSAIAQCGEPRNFIPAFSQFLRKEGVSEDVIDWVEAISYIANTRWRS